MLEHSSLAWASIVLSVSGSRCTISEPLSTAMCARHAHS